MAAVENIITRMIGNALSPEFVLTAACCRWPPSDSRHAAIRAAAAGVTDWGHFLSLVKRQRVVGLVHAALSAAGIEIPSPIAQELASRSRYIAQRNLHLAAETARLQRILDGAEIPTLVLKGVALAQLAYGTLTAKHARDIDLLVPPDRAEAALQLLENEGYALLSPAEHLSKAQRRAVVRYAREVELVHRRNNVLVELQWRVADNALLLQGVDAFSAAQSVTLTEEVSVRTLAQADLFAYLCVHGAHHAWSRLKWLADVNALITATNADIVQLFRHAQHIGAGLCAGQVLLLCQWLFAVELPASLADEIRANKRAAKLAAIAVRALTAPHAEMEVDGGLAGVARIVRTQFLLGQGWAFYAAQCRVASAGTVDVIRLPLPRSLHFLYPLLRLPLWLWRRAAAALNRRTAA